MVLHVENDVLGYPRIQKRLAYLQQLKQYGRTD
jgi:hypothetical protein